MNATTIDFDALDKLMKSWGDISLMMTRDGIDITCNGSDDSGTEFYGSGYDSVYEALEDASGALKGKQK